MLVPAFTSTSITSITYTSSHDPTFVSFTAGTLKYSWTDSILKGTYHFQMVGSIPSVPSITPDTVYITLIVTAPLIKASKMTD